MLEHYIAVGFGGAIGAMARLGLGKMVPSYIAGIPSYIMIVNVLGCFAMGFLLEIMASIWMPHDNWRYFLVPGLLGGFTTFSSFALEFGLLFEKQFYWQAMTYTILSVVLSIVAFFVGVRIVRLWM